MTFHTRAQNVEGVTFFLDQKACVDPKWPTIVASSIVNETSIVNLPHVT